MALALLLVLTTRHCRAVHDETFRSCRADSSLLSLAMARGVSLTFSYTGTFCSWLSLLASLTLFAQSPLDKMGSQRGWCLERRPEGEENIGFLLNVGARVYSPMNPLDAILASIVLSS